MIKLQTALECRGAETLAVREPARAFDRMREFQFSAGVLNYDHASDALHKLIDDLSGMPVLLYGGERASLASSRKMPHLAFAERKRGFDRERSRSTAAAGATSIGRVSRQSENDSQPYPGPYGPADMALQGD